MSATRRNVKVIYNVG